MPRHLLIVLVLLTTVPSLSGQPTIAGLEKTDKGYKHAASGTEFLMPENAKARDARPMPNNGVGVGIYWLNPVVSVSLYWIPMQNKAISEFVRTKSEGPNESYGQEHDTLKAFYGADKIGKPVEFKAGEWTVYKIPIATGFDKDDATVGALYIFEVGTPKDRWRIKMRASYPKKDQAEHAKTVESLLRRFRVIHS